MKHLVDKDKIVAEIERRITENKKDIERASHKNLEDYFEGYEDALALLKQQYLDIIEVKEVDLESEIKEVKHNYKVEDNQHVSISSADIEWLAEHFFELGIKAHKGE